MADCLDDSAPMHLHVCVVGDHGFDMPTFSDDLRLDQVCLELSLRVRVKVRLMDIVKILRVGIDGLGWEEK